MNGMRGLKDGMIDICDDEWVILLLEFCIFLFCLFYFFFLKLNLFIKRFLDFNDFWYVIIDKIINYIMVWRYIFFKKNFKDMKCVWNWKEFILIKSDRFVCWYYLMLWKYEIFCIFILCKVKYKNYLILYFYFKLMVIKKIVIYCIFFW